jgi:hypothetical protein
VAHAATASWIARAATIATSSAAMVIVVPGLMG